MNERVLNVLRKRASLTKEAGEIAKFLKGAVSGAYDTYDDVLKRLDRQLGADTVNRGLSTAYSEGKKVVTEPIAGVVANASRNKASRAALESVQRRARWSSKRPVPQHASLPDAPDPVKHAVFNSFPQNGVAGSLNSFGNRKKITTGCSLWANRFWG